ncbi:hypothetical protein P7K49_029937, partial [Saguinus oedipus]
KNKAITLEDKQHSTVQTTTTTDTNLQDMKPKIGLNPENATLAQMHEGRWEFQRSTGSTGRCGADFRMFTIYQTAPEQTRFDGSPWGALQTRLFLQPWKPHKSNALCGFSEQSRPPRQQMPHTDQCGPHKAF